MDCIRLIEEAVCSGARIEPAQDLNCVFGVDFVSHTPGENKS
jgi:hypothetical protein